MSQKFEELYLQNREYLLNFAYRLSASTAEDLVQIAFMKALEHFASYNPVKKFRTWISSILLNAFRDECRKHKTVRLHTEEGLDNFDAAMLEDTQHRDIHNEVLLRLSAEDIAERNFSESEKTLLQYIMNQDCSVIDFAAKNNIPAGTLRRKIHVLRKKLKKQLVAPLV